MGIRDSINKNPGVTAGVIAVIVVIASLLILWQLGVFGADPDAGRAFFTVDDGKTWFPEDSKQLPPFQEGGKEAVQAHVYECPGAEPFVVFLERYTAEGKAAIESGMTTGAGSEVKKPGDTAWVSRSTPAGKKITELKCPDGKKQGLTQVRP